MAERVYPFFDWKIIAADDVELFQLDEQTLLCLSTFKRQIIGKIHYRDGLQVSSQADLCWSVDYGKKICVISYE